MKSIKLAQAEIYREQTRMVSGGGQWNRIHAATEGMSEMYKVVDETIRRHNFKAA